MVLAGAVHQFPNKLGACLVIFLSGIPRFHVRRTLA